jgi:hypothetical protein
MDESLTQEIFKENLNSSFKLPLSEEQSLALELIECNDLGSSETQEQYSLILRGDDKHYLPQMTYDLQHEKLGTVSLFLVPIRKDANGFCYEAIINRFRK